MNIIVAGGGKVGKTLVRQLAAEGHNLTVIDMDSRVVNSVVEQFDAMHCAARRDFVREYVEACRGEGLKVGLRLGLPGTSSASNPSVHAGHRESKPCSTGRHSNPSKTYFWNNVQTKLGSLPDGGI